MPHSKKYGSCYHYVILIGRGIAEVRAGNE
jgi:hypothetical protein